MRGVYDAVVRPGTSEVWVAHLMLGTDTPQPALDFQETVFPALSILDLTGSQIARLSVVANPGDGQAFGDIVSGLRGADLPGDGELAAVVDTSEDVLIVDAEARIESQLLRPLPGHLPEGIVWVADDVYVQERNTEDIAAFRIARSSAEVSVTPDGPAFPSLAKDPAMPSNLRRGQLMFYSANSDQLPLTQNHWVACASCHLEGRSDAVTWQFAQGPRDTPTNAGGLLDTGFLFRTADRRQVEDYWRTIDTEQGGHFNFDQPAQKGLLQDLASYVNEAIPTPVPPSSDIDHAVRGQALADLRSRGEVVFAQLGCDGCHSGPAKTDSGGGNPALDLGGPTVSSVVEGGVLLHDVGTCVTSGASTDVAHQDIDGNPREACEFDTPALRGLADSAALSARRGALLRPSTMSSASCSMPWRSQARVHRHSRRATGELWSSTCAASDGGRHFLEANSVATVT